MKLLYQPAWHNETNSWRVCWEVTVWVGKGSRAQGTTGKAHKWEVASGTTSHLCNDEKISVLPPARSYFHALGSKHTQVGEQVHVQSVVAARSAPLSSCSSRKRLRSESLFWPQLKWNLRILLQAFSFFWGSLSICLSTSRHSLPDTFETQNLWLSQGILFLSSAFPLRIWKDPELLPICSPGSWSPVGASQQLRCQDGFLEKSWWCFALQLHREQMTCQPEAGQSVHHAHLQLLPNSLASFLQIPGFFLAVL